MVRVRSTYYCEKDPCFAHPFDNEQEALEHERQEHCQACGMLMKEHPMTVINGDNDTIAWDCDGKEKNYDRQGMKKPRSRNRPRE